MFAEHKTECVVWDGFPATITKDGRLVFGEDKETLEQGISRRSALIEFFSSRGEKAEAEKVRQILQKMMRLAEDVGSHQ